MKQETPPNAFVICDSLAGSSEMTMWGVRAIRVCKAITLRRTLLGPVPHAGFGRLKKAAR